MTRGIPAPRRRPTSPTHLADPRRRPMHGKHVQHTTNSYGAWSSPTRMRSRAVWLRGELRHAGDHCVPCAMPSRGLAVTCCVPVPRFATLCHALPRARHPRQMANGTEPRSDRIAGTHSTLQLNGPGRTCHRDHCGVSPLIGGTGLTRWRPVIAAYSTPRHRTAAATQR